MPTLFFLGRFSRSLDELKIPYGGSRPHWLGKFFFSFIFGKS
ncbi:hypothetical protein AR1Y2_2623 [Anaerostipes rhamnosivorans]|uniref:Uncharacterized protein n=1 Tax=Anaerostipes rhamnosivorans TaxID=1229621 RepID=A0A4P8IH02_9FIRM|nr:hypothetical protein AR1Y2_2623 [Anaerostipes rhamnosivorans]